MWFQHILCRADHTAAHLNCMCSGDTRSLCVASSSRPLVSMSRRCSTCGPTVPQGSRCAITRFTMLRLGGKHHKYVQATGKSVCHVHRPIDDELECIGSTHQQAHSRSIGPSSCLAWNS